MNTLEFLSYLRRLKIKVSADGDRLRLSAPKGVLTPTIREQLAERKAEILAFLHNANRSADSILTPLQPVARNENLLLSSAQKRLWFLDQLEPDSSAYNIPLTYRLIGQLNVVALEQGLIEIVRRHEALRTTFASVNGEPIQVITQEINFSLPIVNLRNIPKTDRQTEAQRLVTQERERPFDLATGPLWRSQLLHLDSEEYMLLVTMHHSVSDGWSINVFEQELAALYEAFCSGRPSPLPELPIQYADFAHWQHQWLQSEEFKSQFDYWKRQLGGKLPVLELPTDRLRPPILTDRGAEQTLTLPQKLSEALKNWSQQEGATLAMTLLTGFKTLLYRYTGQEDLIVGSPVAGRNYVELEGLIGFFINTVVIRSDLSGNPSFRKLLSRVRLTALEAYEHESIPFEKLVQELRPERSLNRTPIFQVWFNMLNLADHELQLSELKVEPFSIHSTRSKFDLTLYVQEQTQGIRLQLVYNTDLFEPKRMEEMLDQFQHLLVQVMEHPEERIANFSLVTPKAQLILPNPTQALCSKWDGAIHTRFSQNVQQVPQQPAIVDAQVSWNYAELEERTNLLANYLLAHHIQPQEIVAIYAHRSASLVWAMLGVLKAGAAFVILDPAYPSSRLIDYLQISQPRALLHITVAGELPQSLSEYIETLSCRCRLELTQASIEVVRSQFQGYGSHNPGVEVKPDDLAYVPFTSGSTGKPKGTLSTHRPLSHFLQWHSQTFEFNQADRFSMLSGLSHDPLIRDIFTPLSLGATLYIPQQQDIETPEQLSKWMVQQKITVSHLTPQMGQLLTINSRISQPSQRYFFFGGDILTVQDVDRITNFAPFARCVNFYGATETPQAMGYFIVPKPEERSFGNRVIPVGKGIADVQLLILNSLQQLAGVDEMGEIYVRTPYLAKGYIGSEELTSARFIINPFTNLPGDRLYKTGDLGRYLASGDIEFLGRSDYQVKIRGFRIELAEVEALLNQYPNVQENVVIAREDEPGNKRLVAYVVSHPEQAPATSELRQFLQKQLPDYMVPSAFVMLEALPLTPNGKIDRQALPTPDLITREAENTFVNPRNELEKQLALIWEQVLGVKPIGVKDNFFDLGGHSLLTLRLLNEIEKTLNTKLPVVALFQLTTIEQIASFFQHEDRSAESSIQEPILDSATVAELFNDSSLEHPGLTTEEYKTLLAVVAGRKGKRPRDNSLMVAISEQGFKPPLFFCANAWEEALPLAKNLGKEQPFYLLESGLAVTGNIEDKIKAIAAQHVKDILLIQPEPPYLLGGYSFGGVLIDEVAHQLLAKGKQVSLVVLLDRYGSHPIYKLYQKFVIFLTDHLHHLAPLSFRDKLRYIQENLKRQSSRRLLKSTDGEKSQPPYTPQAYPGKVILFCCIPNKHDSVPPDRQIPIIPSKFTLLFFRRAGWDKRLKPDLEIITVPGDHISMREEPHVKVLAEKLQVCLAQAVIKTEQKNLGDSAPAS